MSFGVPDPPRPSPYDRFVFGLVHGIDVRQLGFDLQDGVLRHGAVRKYIRDGLAELEHYATWERPS